MDRLSTQALYAVTGIVLARLLSHADFGLVGAIMVFQAFASMFVDSGFSSALIQRKQPTSLDYSTVLWFNMGTAGALYVILFFLSPWIASIFGGDPRLVPLARVMFLSFIINAASIVQVNRLMKRMDVRLVTMANSAGLIAGAVVGIYLAILGQGAWAVVWQTVTLAAVKTGILWIFTHWRPQVAFSWTVLKSYFAVGSGVMFTSLLNNIFLNIYAFFIGNRVGLVPLGYYTQADKWSKMGYMSISQTLTSSFLPALSKVQDDPAAFASQVSKMNRFCAYLAFPGMLFLVVMAAQIFHVLFGTKWDGAIPLFQILLVRGIFVIFTSLYNNYILSLGLAKTMVWTEAVRDIAAIAAIIFTLPWLGLQTQRFITYGLMIFLTGQLAATIVTWLMTLVVAARASGVRWWGFITDLLPYLGITAVCCAAMAVPAMWITAPLLLLVIQAVAGAGLFLGINRLAGSKIQQDIFNYLTGRKV